LFQDSLHCLSHRPVHFKVLFSLILHLEELTTDKQKRVENYTWDETFTTNVELETKENALEITRNLVVCLHYTSPHLRRNLGDMEGTVDISEMIRSSAPMHSNILKLVLYPIGSHKKAREASIDDKYRAKLYLEVLWKPNEAFRHSYASLLEDYKTSLNGIKARLSIQP
jgi:hypothetical protein